MSATTEPTKQDKADEITTDPKKKRSKLDKMQEDFSGQVAAAIPAQEKIAKVIIFIYLFIYLFYFIYLFELFKLEFEQIFFFTNILLISFFIVIF